jgi:succinoglycan biosynthesis transport protein ExoP
VSAQQIIDEGLGSEPEFDPAIYWRIARRRYPLFILATVLVFGGAYWFAMSLPPVYQASATILVQSQQIPSSLAQSTVTANADERIQIIQQRLMTRDNLLTIARKFNLYAEQPGRSPSDIVDLTRRNTIIKQIDVGNRAQPGSGAIGFTVSFKNENPASAANVANEFVTAILQQNIQARTTQAAGTSKFFDQQINQLQQDLAAQEARIVDFKNKNHDALPETLASRQSLLTQLQGQTADARGRIATLQSQRQLLASQDGGPIDGGPTTAETQLAQLRLQLVQLRAIYSDTHPEVRGVVAKIDALEKSAAAKSADGNAGKEVKPAPVSLGAARITDIDNQLTALTTQIAQAEQRAVALDASLQKTPEVEAALNVLLRDYQALQTQFTATQGKAAEASMGQQLEQDQRAERFEVLENATAPALPTEPDRQRIVMAGGFGAMVAGVAMVMLAEFLDQSIRIATDLERQLHIRPLASIPYITIGSQRRRTWLRRISLPMAAALVLLVGLYAVQTYYLPLDIVVQKVMDRLKF